MFWNALNAVASTVSMVAFVLTAVYVRGQLKSLEKDRFLTITNDLFMHWQSADFLKAQFWLLHTMRETSWTDFIRAHRADYGETAFHKVGSFYDRIGALVSQGLIRQEQILPTLGGHAIAVWKRIEPLVREARGIENSTLFVNFETLLPACHACYVPSLTGSAVVNPFALDQPRQNSDSETVRKVTPGELAKRLRGDDRPSVLDLRHPPQFAQDPRTIPGALMLLLDEIEARRGQIPIDQDVVAFCA
ncbi:MAG: hypothetical protein U0835_19295 [Isosphaeraceae bacterium]